MINIDKEKLNTLIENGRCKKRYSQRELARRINISHSSLNDLEKGLIKKPDVEILTNIAKELDLSIKETLIVAGYEQLVLLLEKDLDRSNV